MANVEGDNHGPVLNDIEGDSQEKWGMSITYSIPCTRNGLTHSVGECDDRRGQERRADPVDFSQADWLRQMLDNSGPI